MSRAVLISIQPKWCELIASGKKTVEVRKTKPNMDVPFKCYIYQTRRTWIYDIYSRIADWQSKVIGEFVCDRYDEFTPTEKGISFKRLPALAETRLSVTDIRSYLGVKIGYGWHISNLIIYDKLKDLSEFVKYEKCPYAGAVDCSKCSEHHCLKRPPQSWCYVEEMRADG